MNNEKRLWNTSELEQFGSHRSTVRKRLNGIVNGDMEQAGGAIGDIGGSLAGAAVGAAIGSVVPVIGTAIGGLVGAIAGGMGGEMVW